MNSETEIFNQTTDLPQAVDFDEKTCRSTFNRIGFGFFIFELIFAGIGYAASYYLGKHPLDILKTNEWIAWIINYFPMYFIALPVTLFIISRLPKKTPAKNKFSFGKLMLIFLVSWGVSLLGNFIGMFTSSLVNKITGLNTVNALNETLKSTNPLIIIVFAVILAPIVEEFLCRKLIIDHTLKYGEWTAILISGLFFGLIHGNFFQFFYAFMLGMIFAYVYIKTGNLFNTILLHFMTNLLGGLLPVLITGSIDLEYIANASNDPELLNYVMAHIIQFMLMFAFVIVEYGAALAGIIVFIIFCKKVFKTIKPMNIPKGKRFKCLFLNPGTILFLISIITDFTIYLIANQG